MKNVFPHGIFMSGWDASKQNTTFHQTGQTPGMSTAHYFLGCMLTGLASNPSTMLNMEEHLQYAMRVAITAAEESDKWV